MPFAFRASLSSLALSLSLFSQVFAQSQLSTSVPDETQSSAESFMRTVVEKYFTLYADKNLDGLMNLWSEKSPDYASFKKDLQRQFINEDYRSGVPTISRVRVEADKASLRATVNLTTINLKSKQKRDQHVVRNFVLVQEDGKWKIWRSVPAENDLAEALVKAKTEAERTGLLAEEKELMTADLVQALNNQGVRFFNQGDYPQALSIYALAQPMAEDIGDKDGLARALGNIGNVHSSKGSFAQALDYFRKSLAIFEVSGNKGGVALELGNIGIVHARQGDLVDALEYFQKSLAMNEALEDKEGIARALNNVGFIYYSQGDYPKVLECLQRSLALREALGDKPGTGIPLGNIGNIYYEQNNYARALEYFQKSFAVYEAFGDKDGIANALSSIGNVYLVQGNHAQALDYFLKSLAISEGLGDQYSIAIILDNLGFTYDSQGDYTQAAVYLQKSLAIREAIGDKAGIARTLNNIGNIHYHQADYAAALAYFQKSLTLREALGNRDGIATTLSNIAKVDEKEGRYAQALDTASRAAAVARQIGDTDILWKARLTSGIAYRALNQPAQARLAFEEAITTIDSLRAQVAGGGEDQQRFFESKISPYRAMVELLAHEGRPAEALTFAERAKARVLLDVLQNGRVNITKAMTSQEQEQERQFSSQLVSLNTQIEREASLQQPDQARLTELTAQLQKARLAFEDFHTSLYSLHPELKAQRGEAQPLRPEEAAALVTDGASVLLEYVVTDETTYLFAVSKASSKPNADVQVFTLPIKRVELAKQIESFRQQVGERDLGFRASAHQLYDLLLKPAQSLLRGKSNLVIVPDDKLWELPFQALLSDADRYVIETSAIAYAPSLTVLREMRAQHQKPPTDTATSALLALGNPTIDKETIERATLALRDEKLNPLPEAEQEVRALGTLYGPSHSKVYIGPEAREDRVKSEAGQARILHFATHGILNDAAPMYSHLVLAQGDKNEDGLLEAWELMQLDLKADLAVLSACETARGRYSSGEGVIGLTWALFVAGVPSTVVSQWKVESASTRDLMLSFHQQLKGLSAAAKVTKAEALRRAALKLMKSPETSHPFYWAGFVLIGDGR